MARGPPLLAGIGLRPEQGITRAGWSLDLERAGLRHMQYAAGAVTREGNGEVRRDRNAPVPPKYTFPSLPICWG